MTRIGKKEERRAISPRKPKYPAQKTGPKKDNLELGFKAKTNTAPENISNSIFIPKI